MRVPHTLALLFAMMVLALVMTWTLPQGQFETALNEQGRAMVRSIRYRHILKVIATHQRCVWMVSDGADPATYHDLTPFEPVLP